MLLHVSIMYGGEKHIRFRKIPKVIIVKLLLRVILGEDLLVTSGEIKVIVSEVAVLGCYVELPARVTVRIQPVRLCGDGGARRDVVVLAVKVLDLSYYTFHHRSPLTCCRGHQDDGYGYRGMWIAQPFQMRPS